MDSTLTNQTLSFPFELLAESFPSYYAPRSRLFDSVSDAHLSLAAPLVAYWIYSIFFYLLDVSQWRRLDQYRLHEPEAIKSRNRASIGDVVRAVLLQQTIQTLLGLGLLDSSEDATQVNHIKAMQTLWYAVVPLARQSLFAQDFLRLHGSTVVYMLYWWAIPIVQFLTALLIMDTWQYFLHRAFHTNKFLYRKFHSVHHRLYVPYAFGALYNHWFEGLLLDSLGALVSHALTRMSIRQAILLFTFSTLKTVDDHCGYAIPFDPFQLLFPNNSTYHDIHHQAWGIKYNFSQPFYIHWDSILGTRYVDTRSPPDKGKKAQ